MNNNEAWLVLICWVSVKLSKGFTRVFSPKTKSSSKSYTVQG